MNPALAHAVQKFAEALAAAEILAETDKHPQAARALVAMRVAVAEIDVLVEVRR